VAGFISEWWPESNRNGGRHQIGIPGRIASEFALCGVDEAGLPTFAHTQAATDGERNVQLVYYAFDLLHLDGRDVAGLQLIARKALLEPLLANKPGLQFDGHEIGDGELILKHAGKLGFEGVVSKTIDAPYAPGNRGLWRKAKWLNRQEFVIVGGLTRKGHGHISGRCCWATTPMMASSSTLAV
jgi:ATP-dependent DNA ligase